MDAKVYTIELASKNFNVVLLARARKFHKHKYHDFYLLFIVFLTELAIGSPFKDTVVLLRCMAAVFVETSTTFPNLQVNYNISKIPQLIAMQILNISFYCLTTITLNFSFHLFSGSQ